MRNVHNCQSRSLLRGCLIGIALGLLLTLPAIARTSQEFVDSAQQYAAKGDLSAALIELRNAAHEAPQDPTIHLRLAAIYLRLANNSEAEREAKTAETLGAKDTDYLPVLMDALLRQQKFADLLAAVPVGERAAALESKVRQGRALAYFGTHDFDQAEANLREAERLDPVSPAPKLALARVLIAAKSADDAGKIVDELLTQDPKLVEALQIKGQLLQMRGDWDGAMQNFNAVLEGDPKNVQAHLARANLYLLHNDAADADKDLDPILTTFPNSPAANYLRALELAQHKQFAAANEILRKISGSFPKLVEGYYLQGAVQYITGQLDQAEDNLSKYVGRVPDNAKAVRLLAAIALKRGAPSRAINYLKPLAESASPDAGALSLLGDAYLADQKPDLALKAFQAAAEINPDNPQLKTQLAISQINTGQQDQALGLLENVYESQAGAAVAGPVLVLSELRFGHVAKAADIAQALAAKDAGNPVYQTLLGLVRFAQHDYKAAETALAAVAAREPDFVPATQNLAQVYVATGRRDEAKKLYEAFLQRKPGDQTALLALAALAEADHDWSKAADYIGQARSATPSDPKPQIKLVDLYLMQKNLKDANAIAMGLQAQFPTTPDVLDAAARVQEAQGDGPGAAETYRRAYEIAPTSPTIERRYLAALEAAKDYKTAKSVLSQQLAKEPGNPAIKADLIRVEAEISGVDAGLAVAHDFAAKDPADPSYDLVAAALLEKAGRVPEAISVLQKRLAASPSDPVLVSLAQLYLRAGQPDNAESLLKGQLGKEPGDSAARLALASQYLQQRRYDEAVPQYERIIADAPTSAMALNNLAWLYQQRGDMAKAREVAERAVALEPQSAAIADTLGWIMTTQGDNDDALKYLKTAGAESRDPDIQYHLAVALKRAGQTADAKVLLERILGSGTDFQSKSDAQKLLQELASGGG